MRRLRLYELVYWKQGRSQEFLFWGIKPKAYIRPTRNTVWRRWSCFSYFSAVYKWSDLSQLHDHGSVCPLFTGIRRNGFSNFSWDEKEGNEREGLLKLIWQPIASGLESVGGLTHSLDGLESSSPCLATSLAMNRVLFSVRARLHLLKNIELFGLPSITDQIHTRNIKFYRKFCELDSGMCVQFAGNASRESVSICWQV